MIKISVIIPVYNSEKYIRQCLDSVLNSDYENLEIICIDDCSIDSSFEILNEYKQKDSRIVLLKNEENLRAGASRNKALKYATGDYVHFLDSDDWLEPCSYSKLAKVIEEKGLVDIVQMRLLYVTDESARAEGVSLSPYDKIYNLKDDSIIMRYYSWNLCNRLYNRKMLCDYDIEFKDFPCFEDTFFSLKSLVCASSIYFFNEHLYNYRKDNSNSLMANCVKHIEYSYKYFESSIGLCENMSEDLREKFLIWVYSNIYIFSYRLYIKRKISYEEFRALIKRFDFSVFQEESIKKGYLAHSLELLCYPEWKFVLKNSLRKFLKTTFPVGYGIILSIKKKVFK